MMIRRRRELAASIGKVLRIEAIIIDRPQSRVVGVPVRPKIVWCIPRKRVSRRIASLLSETCLRPNSIDQDRRKKRHYQETFGCHLETSLMDNSWSDFTGWNKWVQTPCR